MNKPAYLRLQLRVIAAAVLTVAASVIVPALSWYELSHGRADGYSRLLRAQAQARARAMP